MVKMVFELWPRSRWILARAPRSSEMTSETFCGSSAPSGYGKDSLPVAASPDQVRKLPFLSWRRATNGWLEYMACSSSFFLDAEGTEKIFSRAGEGLALDLFHFPMERRPVLAMIFVAFTVMVFAQRTLRGAQPCGVF